MRMMLQDEIRDLRAPPEAMARWAMQTPLPAQEATYAVLAFLARLEHASSTLLPVPSIVLAEKAVQDPDGFLRQPRGALEHFGQRTSRALAWLDQLVLFRERFPQAAARTPPDALFQLARTFAQREGELEAVVDLLVRECVVPELEELFLAAITYPPLQLLLGKLRGSDPQRSADARRLAAAFLGPLSGKRVWVVRKRLVAAVTRSILGARPLLEELERGGLPASRGRAARGFARRLEDAVGELEGTRVLPAALIARLTGDAAWFGGPVAEPPEVDGEEGSEDAPGEDEDAPRLRKEA